MTSALSLNRYHANSVDFRFAIWDHRPRPPGPGPGTMALGPHIYRCFKNFTTVSLFPDLNWSVKSHFHPKIAILEAFKSLGNSFQVKWENFEGPSGHLSLAKQAEYDFLNKPQMCTHTHSQYNLRLRTMHSCAFALKILSRTMRVSHFFPFWYILWCIIY